MFDVSRLLTAARVRVGRSVAAFAAVFGVVMVAGLLVVSSVFAAAPIPDPVTPSFSGADTPTGSFGQVRRLDADNSTGDVYVIDSGNSVVDRFSSSGVYLSQFAGTPNGPFTGLGLDADVTVDNSGTVTQGNVYLVAEEQQMVFAFDAQGKFLWEQGGFVDPCGVAVDSTGHPWVSDAGVNSGVGVVEQYDPVTHAPTGVTVTPSGPAACHIAFDSADNLYVNHFVSTVDKYEAPTYTTVTRVDSEVETAVDVAVDSSNNDVYMVQRDGEPQVAAVDSSGATISGTPFGSASEDALFGVTVAGAFGKVYVSDRDGGVVRIYDRVGGKVLPSARTGGTSTGTLTSVTLNGRTNPNGTATTCSFEYGTTTALGSSVACTAGAGSGEAEVDVSAGLTGLTGHTVYFYRLVTSSSEGSTTGSIRTFKTEDPPVVTTTEGATSITKIGAQVAGTVNPNGTPVTDCHVEYGTTTAYGSSVPCTESPGSLGEGNTPVAVTATLSGLFTNTTYHFRFVAGNAAGSGEGTDAMFTTLPLAPVVTTGLASTITTTGASIAGTVNPKGAPTTCAVEYGTSTSYGSVTACASSPGSGSSAVAVNVALSGLTPGTLYHYRVTATNAGGTTNGVDKTFTTGTVPVEKPVEKPVKKLVEQIPAGSVTVTGGKVKAGKLQLTISCKGITGGSCKGTIKLTVKVKTGKKTRRLTVASVSYSLIVGQVKSFKVKLSASVLKLLKKNHHLKMTVTGPGVNAKLTLG